MLQTQVNYWTLKENERHNTQMEAIERERIAELIRHNKEAERLGFDTLFETSRSNRVYEGQGERKLFETNRSNLANEAIGFRNAAANQMSARASMAHAAAAQISANASMLQAQVAKEKRKDQYIYNANDLNVRNRQNELRAQELEIQRKEQKFYQETVYPQNYELERSRVDQGYINSFNSTVNSMAPYIGTYYTGGR